MLTLGCSAKPGHRIRLTAEGKDGPVIIWVGVDKRNGNMRLVLDAKKEEVGIEREDIVPVGERPAWKGKG